MRKVMLFGWALLVGALLLFSAPSGAAAATQAPVSGHSSAASSLYSNGVVPNVLGWDPSSAVAAVQAAGFVAQTGPGWVDCGPQYVQQQSPAGGTSAPLGSTVILKINKQPGPGQPCP
jgi:beta-lactam-binding protein with PASTA domain